MEGGIKLYNKSFQPLKKPSNGNKPPRGAFTSPLRNLSHFSFRSV